MNLIDKLWQFVNDWGRSMEIVLLIGTAVGAFKAYYAAKDQNEITALANRKELRPYVYVYRTDDSLYGKGLLVPGKNIYPTEIGCYIVNSGQTPAYNIHFTGRAQCVDTLTLDPDGLDTTRLAGYLPVLGSGKEYYIYFPLDRVSNTADARTYISGRITYEDTFHEWHKLTYSYRYIFARDEFHAEPEFYNREFNY